MLQKLKNNNYVIAISAGALSAMAFAPFNFFLAAIISVSIFFFLLEKKSTAKQAAWLGFSYGFGYFLTGIYWISIALLVDAEKFAWLIPFALTLIPAALALYFAAFAYCYKIINNKLIHFQNYQKIVIFALLWIIFEWLRSVLFTGFAWNLLGYTLMFDDSLIQVASIIGIYGLSLLALLFCLFLMLFLNPKTHQKNSPIFIANFSFQAFAANKFFAIFLLILFSGNFIFGSYRIKNISLHENSALKLRLVQGNIEQDLKWNPETKYRNFLKHIAISNQQDKSGIAAVIWSETAIPYVIDNSPELLRQLALAVPDNGVLISGALRAEYNNAREVDGIWNSVFALNQKGVVDYYDKHHLVPFGEYIPFAKFLPFITKITQGADGFGEGNGPKTIVAQGFSFSPLICYEVIFPNKIIDKNNRPDLLVNVTNDAWFGSSSGPYQHFNMSRMRAVEYGISMARVANNGITAFIDPLGQVKDMINLNETGFIDVNFVDKIDETIFSRFTFWPLSVMVLVLLLFLTINFNRKK